MFRIVYVTEGLLLFSDIYIMRAERLFKTLEISITLILICFSLWLTRDVFEKYQENVTSFKESSVPNAGQD